MGYIRVVLQILSYVLELDIINAFGFVKCSTAIQQFNKDQCIDIPLSSLLDIRKSTGWQRYEMLVWLSLYWRSEGHVPSVLWLCWLGIRKSIHHLNIECWGVGVVVCLERGADCLHMVQLMPLRPKTPSSLASFKSRLVLPFWYQLTQVVLQKRQWNRYGVVLKCIWFAYGLAVDTANPLSLGIISVVDYLSDCGLPELWWRRHCKTSVIDVVGAGKKPVPAEFDNEVMSLLKEFTKNVNKESRISQPPLEDTWK